MPEEEGPQLRQELCEVGVKCLKQDYAIEKEKQWGYRGFISMLMRSCHTGRSRYPCQQLC